MGVKIWFVRMSWRVVELSWGVFFGRIIRFFCGGVWRKREWLGWGELTAVVCERIMGVRGEHSAGVGWVLVRVSEMDSYDVGCCGLISR